MGSVPANYPPPWRVEDALAVPTDSDPIEVGLLVVGAGPAGLACAIRLGQLCEEDPETAERLGDVPVAVLEKGKGPGSHLLSGAVLNPRGLQRLFKGRRRLDELPLFDLVDHESVYYLTRSGRCGSRRRRRCATTGTTSPRSRSSAGSSRRRPRRAVRRSCPRRPPRSSSSPTDGCAASAPPIAAGAGTARSSQNFEPGGDILARITVLAEGTQGHLTGAAIERFGLQGDNPQVWALGVKEVWRVAKPLDRVIHTDGLAAALAREVPRVRRLVRLPDGRRHGHDRDGRRARLPRCRALRARPPPGAEDAQEDPQDPRGRRAAGVGGEDDPGGRLPVVAEAAARAGAPAHRRRRRARERARAEGDPLRDRVGAARGRGGLAGDPARRGGRPPRGAPALRRLAAGQLRLERPEARPEHAAGVHEGLLARQRAGRRRLRLVREDAAEGPVARARRRGRPDHDRPGRSSTRLPTAS